MSVKVELNNDSLPKGTELHVQELGTLVNGQAVDFSAEQVERFESVRGKKVRTAFKDNPHVKVSGSKEGGN